MPFDDSNRLPDAKERFYHLPAVSDPVKEAAAAGRGHWNEATGRTLFHDNVMPKGQHVGKTMRQVPAAYYLTLLARSWFTADRHDGWEHVHRYVTTHLDEIRERAKRELGEETEKGDAETRRGVPLSAPMMPVPDVEPPGLPWIMSDGSDIAMELRRSCGFSCGPFSIMAATGHYAEDVHAALQKLSKPYRGFMNPTQMSQTLVSLRVQFNGQQKQTHELIAGSTWRYCIARVQWENKGAASVSGSQPSTLNHQHFGGEFAGWRNITEAYKQTHYIAHHDGWVLCTATDPTQWITATEWADKLRAAGEPWHLTHRWFVKKRT